MNNIASDNEPIGIDEESNHNPPVINEEVLNTSEMDFESHSFTSETASKSSSSTDVSMNMASDNEPMGIDEESNDSISVMNEEVLNTNEMDFESHSITSETTSEDSSSTDAISTNSEVGLLFLPAELRIEILRHLLLKPVPLSDYEPIPAILSTCHLLRREAFQVMYGENTFDIDFYYHPPYSMLNDRYIRDAIRNLHFQPYLSSPKQRIPPGPMSAFYHRSVHDSKLKMITLLREFASPAIVRGTFNTIFHVHPSQSENLPWYIDRLRNFTNFRVFQVEFRVSSPTLPPDQLSVAENLCSALCEDLKQSLEPVFGPARSFANECGVRFHPQEHANSLPLEVGFNSMES